MATPKNRVAMVKTRYAEAMRIKQHWLPMYQLVGEYVMTRKQNFQTKPMPGEFLTDKLFSSTAPEANRTMASAITGNLWPNGGRSFRIQRPRNIPDSKEVKTYYDTITAVMADYMDMPEAGLSAALDEYMLDQGAFGISGIYVKRTDDYFLPLRYKALNIKNMAICENKDGYVDTVFIDDELSIRQLVQEYGIANVSEQVRKKYNEGIYSDMIRVVQLIEPRVDGKFGFGNKNLPVASIHIEFETNKLLRESGFAQMPAIVARFLKALGEEYGRSPAMFAMPAILRANLVWEVLMKSIEKQINPPLYLLDNGALGGVVDTSAGALNVFNVTGLGEKSPVGTLFDVGDTQGAFALIENLDMNIAKAFFIDRLMDLNNETRMTATETQTRDRLRGEGLSSVFKRQEAEMFSPVIRTSFNNLLEMGLLGVAPRSQQERELLEKGIVPIYIPAAVLKVMETGQKVYDIKYMSPANRIMRTEELQGIDQAWMFATNAAAVTPDILDNLDTDATMRLVADLTGANEKIIRDTKSIDAIRELRAQQMQQQQQIQQAQIGADVGMKTAQAQSMLIGAANGRPKG